MKNQSAFLARMDMKDHTCPFGLKAKDLLQREGFSLDEQLLKTRQEVDAFKEKHGVKTTPQIWIGDQHIGGYDDLREHLGKATNSDEKPSYYPVIILFLLSALMAIAVQFSFSQDTISVATLEMFVAFAICLLAAQKLQNVERFSTMFLNYDLLAKAWIPYGKVYPYAEALSGVLMLTGSFVWLSAPIMLFIGGIGAVSVFKAVYLDKRELKCACVGGDSNVPLGFVSLTENLVMVLMAIWMFVK